MAVPNWETSAMDLITPAVQVAGGILAALLITALWRRRTLGALGGIIVGLVGSAWAGLIAASYLTLEPAGTAAGAVGDPAALAAQVAVGAAGGALLAIVTGLIVGLAER
jgi:hypothetical protein